MSNLPESWPPQGWPSRGDELKWPGEWNGRFGRGVKYADQEAYYVINDAQDQEHLGEEDSVKYYPRPGVKIGDKDPKVTIQKGKPWGGLGLRLSIRAFQWNNPQARDAVFFEYTTANISDYDLPEMCFGYYLHPYVGQDHGMTGDDFLFFDNRIDLSYNWDKDGIGQGGVKTGAFGMAYLESPAKPFDGTDNDDDGLIDEQRDNKATTLVGPYDGINDLNKFLTFYDYTEDMLKEHWDADEDQDWKDGVDANNNGFYDVGEDPGDDVGLDGVGPGELNYNGPDQGECNHKPDFVEGLGCEPNFAFTDVSESDMLGLTSFHTYDHESEPRIHSDDKRTWEYFSDASYDPFQDQPGEWVNLFATGTFPLYKGRTERISMGLVASYDPVEGLNSADHDAPSLFRKKKIAQIIYERDYRFAMPPKMPTLKASAGDGKVVLTWNDVAEKYTREPLLDNANDFEGYKLFKATDKTFNDAEIITDGYGTPLYKRPIFQCDLNNNIKGFADFGSIDGVSFNLGTDSGIKHYFIDTDVENGKTYYYAIVAYDRGLPDVGDGVTPSENNVVIELDEAEEIKAHGRNVAIVTPHQMASGYIPPQIEVLKKSWPPSTGDVWPKILMKEELKVNHTYKLSFSADTIRSPRRDKWGYEFTCNGYNVYDVTDSSRLVFSKARTGESYENAPSKTEYIDSLGAYTLAPNEKFQTDRFEGLAADILLNVAYPTNAEMDPDWTGWKNGNHDGNVKLKITPSVDNIESFPWEYEIIWGDPGVYTGVNRMGSRVRDENRDRLERGEALLEQEFDFYVINKTLPDSQDAYGYCDLAVVDLNESGEYEPMQDKVLVGVLDDRDTWYRTLFAIKYEEGSAYPQPNDVYRITFKRPFFSTDSMLFRVLPAGELDKDELAGGMEDIKVVPNPYVATNRMEPTVANTYLNQRRRLLFTHLPARCTIKIFTMSGVLVDEIDVENASDNGTAHWNLLSREGLEVSAGIYIYHVEARETGDTKVGKFGVIK